MPLSDLQAREVYDRIGRAQDSQAFYEDAPVERMVALSDLAHATAVVELGCGTGRLARSLLAEHLPPQATYLATDISPRMARIAQARLRPWGDRARVVTLQPGCERLPGDDGEFDRFIATYVLDLLELSTARRLLDEAARLVCPGGRLSLAGITTGSRGLSRLVMGGWGAFANRFPRIAGGCRPIDARALLDRERWTAMTSEVVTRWAVSSQVVVAIRTDVR